MQTPHITCPMHRSKSNELPMPDRRQGLLQNIDEWHFVMPVCLNALHLMIYRSDVTPFAKRYGDRFHHPQTQAHTPSPSAP